MFSRYSTINIPKKDDKNVIVIILAVSLIFFFSYFQQKKTTFLLKQREIQQRFDEEITKSKLEIQEQALQNISWEIHDNVGQLLSVAKMQLNILQLNVPENQQSKRIYFVCTQRQSFF